MRTTRMQVRLAAPWRASRSNTRRFAVHVAWSPAMPANVCSVSPWALPFYAPSRASSQQRWRRGPLERPSCFQNAYRQIWPTH